MKNILKQLEKWERLHETLKKYSFRKHIREAGPNEQVSSISIYDFKKEKQKDDLPQDQEVPSHQRNLPKNKLQRKSTFLTTSAWKEQIDKQ